MMKLSFMLIAALCISVAQSHRLVKRASPPPPKVTTKTTKGETGNIAVPSTTVTKVLSTQPGILDQLEKIPAMDALATQGGGSSSADAARAAATSMFNDICGVWANRAETLRAAVDADIFDDAKQIVADIVTMVGDPPADALLKLTTIPPLSKVAADAKAATEAASDLTGDTGTKVRALIDALILAGRKTNELKPIIAGLVKKLTNPSESGCAATAKETQREIDTITANPIAGPLSEIKKRVTPMFNTKDPKECVSIAADVKPHMENLLWGCSDYTPDWKTLIQAWNKVEAERTGDGDPNKIKDLLAALQDVMNRLKQIPDLAQRIGEIQPFWDRANKAVADDIAKGADPITVPGTNKLLIELGNKILGILPNNVKDELDLDPTRGPRSRQPSSLLKDVATLNENQLTDDPNLTDKDLDRIAGDLKGLEKDSKVDPAKLEKLKADLKNSKDGVAADKTRQPPDGLSDATLDANKQLTRDAFDLGLPSDGGNAGEQEADDYYNKYLALLLKIIRDVKKVRKIAQQGGDKVKENLRAPVREFHNDVAEIIYIAPWAKRFSDNILQPFFTVLGLIMRDQGFIKKTLSKPLTDNIDNLKIRVVGEALLAANNLRAVVAERKGAAISAAAPAAKSSSKDSSSKDKEKSNNGQHKGQEKKSK